jgi:hypothetical protein
MGKLARTVGGTFGVGVEQGVNPKDTTIHEGNRERAVSISHFFWSDLSKY